MGLVGSLGVCVVQVAGLVAQGATEVRMAVGETGTKHGMKALARIGNPKPRVLEGLMQASFHTPLLANEKLGVCK